jgi:hypothetical protein
MSRKTSTSYKPTGYKMLACKKGCGHESRVPEEVDKVTCWRCVQDDLRGYRSRANDSMDDEEFRKYVNED